jgi:chemotaxis signal transduction protein
MESGREYTGQSEQLFQAIRCGSLRVAFPYGWANTIVEKFSLTAVPRAPAWLAGAANIDGQIYPVVDLAHWVLSGGRAMSSNASHAKTSSAARLLIGGIHSNNGDDRLAVLFNGLPQQLGRSAAKFQSHVRGDSSASHLTDGTIETSNGERFALINVERLIARLSAELSTV